MHTPTLRLGLAGLGRHGRRYAQHLLAGDVPGATLAGFWRRDPSRAREDERTLGVRSLPTVEDLIADPNIDAVIGAVPASVHLSIAELCTRHDKPLLLEKPLAANATEGRRIVAQHARRLMIAHTLRFDPLVRALAGEMSSRGRLVGFGFEQRLEPRGLAWEADPAVAGGGVLIQTGIHGVDAILFLTGATSAEVSAVELDYRRGNRTEDQALVALTLRGGAAADGVRGDVRTSKIGGSRHHRYQLFFEDGGVEADFVDRTLYSTRGRERTPRVLAEAPTVAAVLGAFVGWLASPDRPCPVPAHEALAALEIVEAAYRRADQRTGGSSK